MVIAAVIVVLHISPRILVLDVDLVFFGSLSFANALLCPSAAFSATFRECPWKHV